MTRGLSLFLNFIRNLLACLNYYVLQLNCLVLDMSLYRYCAVNRANSIAANLDVTINSITTAPSPPRSYLYDHYIQAYLFVIPIRPLPQPTRL